MKFNKYLNLDSLYKNFVRLLLEFSVLVWSPILKSDCDNIEIVQHSTTNLVPSIRNFSYKKRHEALNIQNYPSRESYLRNYKNIFLKILGKN